MTLLHQAAQKAVEALKYMQSEKVDYMIRNKLGDPSKESATRLANDAIAAVESALQQQPEPVTEPPWWGAALNRRATVEQWMFDAARGKRTMPTPDELRAWAIKLGTPAEGEPALQHQEEPAAVRDAHGNIVLHNGREVCYRDEAPPTALQQEVPREPVAPHTALLEQALSAMAEVQEQADSGSPDGTLIPDSDWRAFVDAHAELSMLWTAWRDSPGWEPLDDTTAAVPLGVLERGEGGAFRVHANMDALRAIYAMPPGEHMLYASPSTTRQQEAPDQSYGGSVGYKVAMCVLQSELYHHLDDDERADCDELIRRGQAAPRQQEVGSFDKTGERINALAKEAGFHMEPMTNMLYTVRGNHAQLVNFARLVLAAAPSTPEKAGGVSDGVREDGNG